MESESHLCGWHLPPIKASKGVETRPKIKCSQRGAINKLKYKTKPSDSEQFQHFPDAGRYIDEYRRNHTVASAAMDWGHTNGTKSTAEDKFSKYIDIRVPEKKICLTGLPQLRPPAKHVIRTHAVHESTEGSPFLTGVPHLPHLTLNGAAKNAVKRETNRNDGHGHKKSHRKKKQGRLPYLKPPEVKL